MGKLLSIILITVACVGASFLLTYSLVALLGWLIGFEVTWKLVLAIWIIWTIINVKLKKFKK